jgi:uncharacterized protein YwqG
VFRRVFGVAIVGWSLAACETDREGDAAPVQSARPAAAVVVLAGRPLSARLPQRVAALAEPALGLVPSAVDEQALPIGKSKIGGGPDLPQGTGWPLAADGRPLAFLAQLELSEIARRLPGWELPKRGLLSFFYDAAQQPFGYQPVDRAGFRVIHSDREPDRLRRLAPPRALAPPPLPVKKLEFENTRSYPDPESYSVKELALKVHEVEDYRAFLDNLASARPWPDHQVLGYPTAIEDDIQAECQLVSNGVDLTEEGDDDTRWRALEKGAGEWRLLLKLGADRAAGMPWAEGGRLYFMIRRHDLRNRKFDGVWAIFYLGE